MGNKKAKNSEKRAESFATDITTINPREGPFPPRTEQRLEDHLIDILVRRKNTQYNNKLSFANALTQEVLRDELHNYNDSVTPADVERLASNIRLNRDEYQLVWDESRNVLLLETMFDEGRRTFTAEHFPELIDGNMKLVDTKFGAIANTELGNVGYRDGSLQRFYQIAERLGVKSILHCGDIIAGPSTAKTRGEIRFESFSSQAEYFARNYPHVEGINTYFITAPDCEGKYIKDLRANVGTLLARKAKEHGRQDIHFLGHKGAVIEMPVTYRSGRNKVTEYATVQMAHGTGKVPYARSYPMQKMIQAFQGGKKPDVLLLGHLMQLEHILEREVWGVQVGGFKEQTPSMVNDRQHSDVGGVIVTINKPLPGEEIIGDQKFTAHIDSIASYNSAYYKGRENE